MELPRDVLARLIQLHPKLDSIRCAGAENLTEITVLNDPVPYAVLYSNYIALNQPVILGQWATESWPCRKLWCNYDNEIQWNYLLETFGNEMVPVADCTEQVSYEHSKLKMKFEEFICYLKNHDKTKLLYLKDWHFKRDFPSSDAYTTPVYFQSDWLNEFWDNRSDCHDDYRFLYFGPQGSWSPFHADVFRSFSWSANVFGKKKWILCPAGVEEKLKDGNGHLPSAIDTATLKERGIKYFEVTQNAGEVLFVPSGWYHQVCNLEVTLSINHNWINAANIDIVWRFIENSLVAVEHEIDEHRHTMDNWVEHCQLFLRADIGVDVVEFLKLLNLIAVRRLSTGLGGDLNGVQGDRALAAGEELLEERRNQVIYDLFRICKVLQEMLRKPKFVEILEMGCDRLKDIRPLDLLNRLQLTVDISLKQKNLSSEWL